MCVPVHMPVSVSKVEVPVMAMRHVNETAENGKQAQPEANNETDEIQIRPSHIVCSFNTCRSRSANPGVSRISASRMKHFRESS